MGHIGGIGIYILAPRREEARCRVPAHFRRTCLTYGRWAVWESAFAAAGIKFSSEDVVGQFRRELAPPLTHYLTDQELKDFFLASTEAIRFAGVGP